MTTILTVVTAASNHSLTTLAAVKDELRITSDDDNSYLESLIRRVSAEICNYIGVPAASDGSRTLARETLREVFRYPQSPLVLARYPVSSISSILDIDGATVDTADYELAGSGYIYRMEDTTRVAWSGTLFTVTYVAGWILPGEVGRNLPYDIEGAALSMVKGERSGRSRDPRIKSEDLPGVRSVSYWVGGVGSDGESPIPPDIASKIDPYRYLTV